MRRLMRCLALAGGLAATALVLLPPLSNAANQLFAAHMMQHLILIIIAAPLLVASGFLDGHLPTPLPIFFKPVRAWLLFVGVFVFWHWPAMFRWAAGNEAGRLLEHASILAAALPFWSVALGRGAPDALNYGMRGVFVMAAAFATDLPGVVMVFAPQALCAMPQENALRWGLTPLEDQQIAGLLMWVPANLGFFAIATWLFARWLSEAESTSRSSSPSNLVTQ